MTLENPLISSFLSLIFHNTIRQCKNTDFEGNLLIMCYFRYFFVVFKFGLKNSLMQLFYLY